MSGKRNEAARSKRRQQLKKTFSLTSVPKSEDGVVAAPKLTLANHFGWTVVQKRQIGDGMFPHLYQFHEKPDVHGRDFDKVTYVLYMDKGTVIDKKTSLKETQTAVSGVLVADEKPYEAYIETPFVMETVPERTVMFPPERTRTFDQEPRGRRRKKKLISDFYYISKNRSRSRSANRHKGGHSDADNEWNKIMPDWSKSYHSELEPTVSEIEGQAQNVKDENYDMIMDEIEREKEEAKRKGKNEVDQIKSRWPQMRAGAERIEEENNKEKPTMEIKRSSRLLEYVKFTSDKNFITEELLKTSSGTNQYLYVPKKRAVRP